MCVFVLTGGIVTGTRRRRPTYDAGGRGIRRRR
jgi:hypothetical protein